MLSSRGLFEKLGSLVDDSYLRLLLILVGPDVLSLEDQRKLEREGLITGQRPLVDSLYVLIRNRPPEGYPKDATLNQLLSSVSLIPLPVLNDAQLSTLDNAKASIIEAVESSKEELKKQIRQRLIEASRIHRQHVAVKRVENAAETRDGREKLKKEIAALMPTILAYVSDVFNRSLSSALTDIINDATLDSATSDSLLTGISPRDVQVYKKVVNDDSLCEWCSKLYQNPDGSPRIFKLSQLQSNGSNYGKPKSEWKATISKTHPRCRCQLFYLR